MYAFLITLLLIVLPMFQQAGSTQAAAEQKPDGMYYLVLSGDAGMINRACSYGDCGRGFATRIDALNYWTGSLLGPSLGINIAPIPAVVSVTERPNALLCIGDNECMASVMKRYDQRTFNLKSDHLRQPPIICFRAPCNKPPPERPPVRPPVICFKAPCP